MIYDVPMAIKAISDTVSKFFEFKKTETEHQAETEIIKTKKNTEKAIDIAINLFDVIINSNGYLTDKQLKEVKRNKIKFDKLLS